MAPEAQLLWIIALDVAAAVLGVVILLLGLLRQSVRPLGELVGAVWSAAVGVFVHTVTAAPQLERARRPWAATRDGPARHPHRAERERQDGASTQSSALLAQETCR